MPKTSKKRIPVTGNSHFKHLVRTFREDLPLNWLDKAVAKFPDLDNEEGRATLKNIYYGRSAADVEVILYLSDLATVNKAIS